MEAELEELRTYKATFESGREAADKEMADKMAELETKERQVCDPYLAHKSIPPLSFAMHMPQPPCTCPHALGLVAAGRVVSKDCVSTPLRCVIAWLLCAAQGSGGRAERTRA